MIRMRGRYLLMPLLRPLGCCLLSYFMIILRVLVYEGPVRSFLDALKSQQSVREDSVRA